MKSSMPRALVLVVALFASSMQSSAHPDQFCQPNQILPAGSYEFSFVVPESSNDSRAADILRVAENEFDLLKQKKPSLFNGVTLVVDVSRLGAMEKIKNRMQIAGDGGPKTFYIASADFKDSLSSGDLAKEPLNKVKFDELY